MVWTANLAVHDHQSKGPRGSLCTKLRFWVSHISRTCFCCHCSYVCILHHITNGLAYSCLIYHVTFVFIGKSSAFPNDLVSERIFVLRCPVNSSRYIGQDVVWFPRIMEYLSSATWSVNHVYLRWATWRNNLNFVYVTLFDALSKGIWPQESC